MIRLFQAAAVVTMISCFAGTACAQPGTPSLTALQFAKSVATACTADWAAQKCLSAVSDSNMTMLSNYGADLQNRKMEPEAETLKQECAATTAANQQTVPAYAMHSALTACANAILGIVQRTGVSPDPSHYQLLVAPLLCLGGDPSCAQITAQMQAYVRP
jgi:hypothetical protein